ncbi:MAG: MATE family efflux transporter, partial [Dorea sp.]
MYIVLVLQNVVTLSVNLADNMMIGSYSEVALSGVAAVNQIQFVYQQVLMALGDGLVIFCSQYWGKKQTEPMKRIAATVLWTGIGIAMSLFIVISLFPHQVLRIFTTDEPIISQGAAYLGIIRFTYLFFAVTQILLAVLRSVEVVRIAFGLSIMTFFVNCGINWVLIYGRYGAPELGVSGAAIGTLVARIAECVILIVYIARKESHLKLKLRDFFRFDKELSRDYFKVVTPMICVQTLWGLNTALQTVILGHMTAAAIAANSVASTVFLMVKSMAVGAASTA